MDVSCIIVIFEPRYEMFKFKKKNIYIYIFFFFFGGGGGLGRGGGTKTQISFMVTAKLISAFVFTTRIVQSLFYLNPKFQASSHLL